MYCTKFSTVENVIKIDAPVSEISPLSFLQWESITTRGVVTVVFPTGDHGR